MTLPSKSWLTDPYKPLFLEGIVLVWAGVLHWFLLGTGLIEHYLSIFHSLTQVQGFLTCFALGFLFTFVPRRTGTAPPKAWQLAVAMVSPALLVALAFFERFAHTQVVWLVLMIVVLQFLVVRLRSDGGSTLPAGFLWVPVGFAFSVLGSVLTAIGGIGGDDWMWVHDIGRAIVLQGLFTGFIVGVGGTLLPMFLHGRPAVEDPDVKRRNTVLHALGVVLLLASFWLEGRGWLHTGFAVRAAVPLGLLLLARLHRPPAAPGLHRKLMWLATWMLPLGYAIVAVWPEYRRVGLHVVFIGSFALLAFAVGLHVMVSHQGAGQRLAGGPVRLWLFVVLMAVALGARAMVDLDPPRFYPWIALASGAFLTATLAWVALVLRPILRAGRAGRAATTG